MNQYTTLDRSDIEDVFNELLDENGQATSKEVKEELQNRGFWATQAIIGVAIREIADEQNVDWDFNGVYRTYKQGTQMSPTSAPVQQNLFPVPKAKRTPVSSADRKQIDTADARTGDWECTDLSGDPVMYFKSTLTAPQARYAYALHSGVDYVNVRSIRVS